MVLSNIGSNNLPCVFLDKFSVVVVVVVVAVATVVMGVIFAVVVVVTVVVGVILLLHPIRLSCQSMFRRESCCELN